MTNADLEKDWKEYGVVLDGKVTPLTNQFVMCWGPVKMSEGKFGFHAIPDRDNPEAPLMFDDMDSEGQQVFFFFVRDDQLMAMNAYNPEETRVLGALVRL
jgi:hypothetical protein